MDFTSSIKRAAPRSFLSTIGNWITSRGRAATRYQCIIDATQDTLADLKLFPNLRSALVEVELEPNNKEMTCFTVGFDLSHLTLMPFVKINLENIFGLPRWHHCGGQVFRKPRPKFDEGFIFASHALSKVRRNCKCSRIKRSNTWVTQFL